MDTSKLKPFDLEAAKAGAPVCTRDGRPARIICWDRKGDRPIVALVKQDDHEDMESFYLDGTGVPFYMGPTTGLRMAPVKHEAYTKLFRNERGHLENCGIFDSKDKALSFRMHEYGDYEAVGIAKMEWEE